MQAQASEASTIQQRRDRVALETVRLLAEAGDDHAPLAVDRDLAAINEVRPLARLAAQLRLRIGTRDRRLVRAAPFRRRPRTRLSQRQRGTPVSSTTAVRLPLKSKLTVRLGRAARARHRVITSIGSRRGDGNARAQTRKRRVRLRMEAVDREMRTLDQPVLLAQLKRAQEQTLEQRRIDETACVSMRERLVHQQPLAQPVAEEAAQIEAHARLPQ
jgi:hypothetical protein